MKFRNFGMLSVVAAYWLVGQYAFSIEILKPQAASEKLSKAKIVLSFVGKGSSVPFDAGVVRALEESIPALKEDNAVILSASSSGAIPAIFFSCFGITKESIARLEDFLVNGNEYITPALKELRESEDPAVKSRVLLGVMKVLAHENLHPYVAAAVGANHLNRDEMKNLASVINQKATCKPQVPFVIVAANQDILENRVNPKSFQVTLLDFDYAKMKFKDDKKFAARTDKAIDYASFTVNWKPAYLKEYMGNREKFRRMNPDLNLRQDGVIGKVCTYFADPIMASALELIPYSERLCDIRVVDTPYDRMQAIIASSAEPTYYDIFTESVIASLNAGVKWGDLKDARALPHGDVASALVPGSRNRLYWGGFAMPLVAQDIRRMVPGARVIATGFNRLNMAQEGKFIQSMSLVNHAEIAKRSEYWADFAVRIDPEVHAKIRARAFTAKAESDAGYRSTKECLLAEARNAPKTELCRPLARDVVDPLDDEVQFFAKPAKMAFTFTDEDKQLVSKQDNLPVWRGLGPLLGN